MNQHKEMPLAGKEIQLSYNYDAPGGLTNLGVGFFATEGRQCKCCAFSLNVSKVIKQ